MSEILFHFLNVGKGNCTIIEFSSERLGYLGHLTVIDIDDSRSISEDERYLIEGTSQKAKLTDPIVYIRNRFSKYNKIFRFILTHPDMDHMSGIKELFARKSVLNFWDTENNKFIDSHTWKNSPYNKEDWDFYQSIRKSIKDPKIFVFYRGDKPKDGIEILSPTPELVNEANEKEDYDHLSYVLMVKFAGRKVLLCGDATKKALENVIEYYDKEDLKCDVLFAPNHGSPNHISKEILDVFNPDLTIVSVSKGTDYARDLYSRYGIVLSTKHFGNIWVKINANGQIYFQTEYQNYKDKWYNLENEKITIEIYNKIMGYYGGK